MTSPIFLRSLPRATVKPSMLGKLRESTCIICFEEFLVGDQITLLPCAHLYHTDCIITALKTNNTCPLCRREFPRVETQPEEPQRTRRRRRSRELFMMMWFSPERFPNTPGEATKLRYFRIISLDYPFLSEERVVTCSMARGEK